MAGQLRARWWLLAAAAVVVAGVAVTLWAPWRRPRLPDLGGANLLLVTLDTTRADHLGCYGYGAAETPNLDRLAAEGALFASCITPTAFTLPSHSSIMTGLYPPYHGVRLNGGAALSDVQTTLAESLHGAGYRCGAFVGAFVLDQRWGLKQGFDRYDDHFDLAPDQPLDLAGVQRPADKVVDAALAWLGERDPRPFFAWVHMYDPHQPYDPPAPYRSRFEGRGPAGLYDGEIAFADSQVGRLLGWLDDGGVADSTVVVVVGDHGEGLGSHGEDEHGYYIYDYAVHVPLLMRLPRGPVHGARVPAQVRTIDVLPTVLDLLGVAEPPHVQGQSLAALLSNPRAAGPPPAYSESMAVNLQYGWSPLYSLRTLQYKLIEAPRSELYDLASDPGETSNVFASRGDVADGMRRTLDALRGEIAEGAPEVQQADLDGHTQAMLAALGYVGGAAAARQGENLADPKDRHHLYDAVGYAAHEMIGKDYAGAADTLEIVLREDPEIPQARLLLATSYEKLGRADEAKTILESYLEEIPDSVQALISLAKILSEEGQRDQVLAICRRALEVDDHNTQAYELMAGVYMDRDDHARALPLLERVVSIQPKLTRSRNNLAAALIGVGRLDEAESLLGDIISEYPKFPLAHYHLGLLDEKRGRLDEARKAYEQEVEDHPKEVVPRFNLGNLLLRTGDRAAGEREMRRLIEEAPERPRPYLMLARSLLSSSGSLDEVARLARAGLERAQAPELKALGYFLVADVCSRQGRRVELEEALRKARYYQAQIGAPGPAAGGG